LVEKKVLLITQPSNIQQSSLRICVHKNLVKIQLYKKELLAIKSVLALEHFIHHVTYSTTIITFTFPCSVLKSFSAAAIMSRQARRFIAFRVECERTGAGQGGHTASYKHLFNFTIISLFMHNIVK